MHLRYGGHLMGLFDRFTKKAEPEKPAPKRKTKSEKELATEAGEPWVKVINFDVDPTNPGNGAFEIDYNDKFLSQLVSRLSKGAQRIRRSYR